TRSVTRQAMESSKVLEKIHNISVDYDLLLTASLLHDVSKVIEYGEKGYTKYGELIQHGFYGVQKAVENNLPIEVAHVINTHTNISKKVPAIIEAIILHYVDYLDSDILQFESNERLFLQK